MNIYTLIYFFPFWVKFVVIPYILESNPDPFYSFRKLKNHVRIRFMVENWVLEN
jgi:hypothetical protein